MIENQTENENDKINIMLQLDGDVARAFLQCRDAMGQHRNAPVARGFIVQKLRETGYLPKVQTAIEPLELEQQAA